MVDFFRNHTDACQPVYYSYGLLAKYFRGPADSYALIQDVTNASNVPAACVRQHDTGMFSVAAMNMDPSNTLELSLQLPMEAAAISLYRFTYTSGDAQKGHRSNCTLPKADPSTKVVVGKDGGLKDRVPPATLVVYSQYI